MGINDSLWGEEFNLPEVKSSKESDKKLVEKVSKSLKVSTDKSLKSNGRISNTSCSNKRLQN